jgi:hypothetical protein
MATSQTIHTGYSIRLRHPDPGDFLSENALQRCPEGAHEKSVVPRLPPDLEGSSELREGRTCILMRQPQRPRAVARLDATGESRRCCRVVVAVARSRRSAGRRGRESPPPWFGARRRSSTGVGSWIFGARRRSSASIWSSAGSSTAAPPPRKGLRLSSRPSPSGVVGGEIAPTFASAPALLLLCFCAPPTAMRRRSHGRRHGAPNRAPPCRVCFKEDGPTRLHPAFMLVLGRGAATAAVGHHVNLDVETGHRRGTGGDWGGRSFDGHRGRSSSTFGASCDRIWRGRGPAAVRRG